MVGGTIYKTKKWEGGEEGSYIEMSSVYKKYFSIWERVVSTI